MTLIHFPCLANWCKAALAKLQFRSLYHFVLFGVVLLQVSSRLIEILQRHIYSSTWGVDSVVQFHSATFRPSLRVVLEIYTSIWGWAPVLASGLTLTVTDACWEPSLALKHLVSGGSNTGNLLSYQYHLRIGIGCFIYILIVWDACWLR